MILAYPFQISGSGEAVHTDGVKSQLAMLLNTMPGSRLHETTYGVDVMALEQELLSDFAPERTLFIVQLKEKCARFIPDMLITDVTVERGANDGEIIVNVFYRTRAGEKDVYVWQPDSSLK